MRYCEKCGYVMDEFNPYRSSQNCPVCGGLWSEDDMTALKYAELSETEKDAYDEQLLNRIKSNPNFDEGRFYSYGLSTENGDFWAGFRVDKFSQFEGREEDAQYWREERKKNEPFKPFPEIDWKKANQKAEESERKLAEWNTSYKNKSPEEREHIPRCPICQSTRLSKISMGRKFLEAGFGGIWGMDVMGKTYECRNCGSKF
ncbi:MAG: hypothetical protein NC293_10680 [Roseburia sp.]|nr:hypothetical protein [Roseburia sp.]